MKAHLKKGGVLGRNMYEIFNKLQMKVQDIMLNNGGRYLKDRKDDLEFQYRFWRKVLMEAEMTRNSEIIRNVK